MGAAVEVLADLPAPLSDREGPLDRVFELAERAADHLARLVITRKDLGGGVAEHAATPGSGTRRGQDVDEQIPHARQHRAVREQ